MRTITKNNSYECEQRHHLRAAGHVNWWLGFVIAPGNRFIERRDCGTAAAAGPACPPASGH